MKKALLVLRIIVCVLCFVFALVFLGVESFVLTAGEWKLYENRGIVLIQQIIKAAISGAGAYTALMGALKPSRSTLRKGACFFVLSVFSVPFTASGIGFIFMGLSIAYIVTDTGLQKPSPRGEGGAAQAATDEVLLAPELKTEF